MKATWFRLKTYIRKKPLETVVRMLARPIFVMGLLTLLVLTYNS
jgi:hypothetical protein